MSSQLHLFRAKLVRHIQLNVWEVASGYKQLLRMFPQDFWVRIQDPNGILTIGDLRNLEFATAFLLIRDRWLSSLRTYDCYLDCIGEINNYLGSSIQEEWRISSIRARGDLIDPGLSVSDALTILRSWIEEIDDLLRAVNSFSIFEVNSIAQTAHEADIRLHSQRSGIVQIRSAQPELVGTRYVADRLGLTTQRISQMIVSKELPSQLVVRGGNGNPYKFNRLEIDKWISTERKPVTP